MHTLDLHQLLRYTTAKMHSCMNNLTKKDIEHIATLARLDLSEVEKDQYAKELGIILDYVEMLNELDTSVIGETTQVTGLENVVREDVATTMLEDDRKAMLAQFPERIGSLLKVKAVFAESDE